MNTNLKFSILSFLFFAAGFGVIIFSNKLAKKNRESLNETESKEEAFQKGMKQKLIFSFGRLGAVLITGGLVCLLIALKAP